MDFHRAYLSTDIYISIYFVRTNQDDDGDNAFHIAADAAKYIRECLQCIVIMLQYPGAALEVRNHRQVLAHYSCLIQFSSLYGQGSCLTKCDVWLL